MEKNILELEKHTRSNLPQAPYIHKGIKHQNEVLETAFLNWALILACYPRNLELVRNWVS